ncbi:metalloregulator ArsR/SmtB family transcription factor [Thermostaphylospora chromogena]|uniref:DNA-binding transcriptional regulator, ArsR family n=1 Tax=Thermostaphylospora chromogena TaxID=35622 RepID=A0A1H1AB81_9ACTN|nr:metalloregulator ArsR/SmtB family transcription factor [Thermostaphylospora chromogena]SDQ36820.1 DNA-binding transcriptional regulator, ArsR family [Thermostaphylospora chromogena]
MVTGRTFEALAHERRRQVLRILRTHDQLSAGEIAAHLSISRPTLSGHLNVLKDADLIVGERDGTTIWYRLNTSVMEDVLYLVFDLMSKEHTAVTRVEPLPCDRGASVPEAV